jgi:hypothetical protein
MSNVLSVAFICLHIVYDFVESNGIFVLPAAMFSGGGRMPTSTIDRCLSFCIFSFTHFIACPSSICGF